MKYLLDTNVVSVYVNARSEAVRERIRAIAPSDVVLCSVVWAELFYGIAKSQNPARSLERVRNFADLLISIPFDNAAAELYGEIRLKMEKTGTLIGPNDLMIAAIAATWNLTLVTHNTAEFPRVPGLKWTDWQ